jgi:molybdopterin converting factor subunit 1
VSIVTVQLFASYADSFGSRALQIPVSSHSTVRDLVAAVRALPGGDALPESARVAINRAFASPDQVVSPQDEVALIPPVAGG